MEVTEFKDATRWNRGYMPAVPPEEVDAIGDAAYTGSKNVLFSPYGQPRSWRGISLYNQPATSLLQLVGTLLGGLTRGNIVLGPGGSYWFIGAGDTYVDDFLRKIGVASSTLQLHFHGNTYQAGLPAPSAPLLQIATDSAGNPVAGLRKGSCSASLTRRRSITGAESAESNSSNVLNPQGNQLRVTFPAVATMAGQDEWGLYFTRNGFGDVGPHFLLRVVRESEIAPVLGLSNATAAGGLSTYTSLSSVASNGRLVALALKAAGGSAPVVRGTTVSRSAGKTKLLRLNRAQASVAGDYLVAGLAAEHVHTIAAGGLNRGTVAPLSIAGAWTYPASLGNPNGATVEIQQLSTTQFQWRPSFESTWTGPVNLDTAPVALGVTGLSVSWSAASSSVDEINNTFTITPMGILPPTGWTLQQLIAGTDDNRALGVYTKQTVTGEPLFYDFTTTVEAQLYGVLGAYADVDTGAPLVQQASATTTSTTTHALTFAAPTGATNRIVFLITAAGDLSFTPQAPLVLAVNASAGARTLDFNFSDDELNDIIAPQLVEPPPAGTHCFTLGVVFVIGGSLDGTALSPSLPNQPELYDLASTIYLNPVEAIVRIDARPQDGSTFIATRNSLQTPVFTGDPDTPIITRAIWPYTGIANPAGACVTPRRYYAASSLGGLVRTTGNRVPDDSFSRPILSDIMNWRPEETVLGYDPRNLGMVVVANGRELLVFFEEYGLWSSKLYLDDFYYATRQTTEDGAITAGQFTLTAASNPWEVSDVGKVVGVDGAGLLGGSLDTIIESFVSPGEILLRDQASTTVSSARVSWGADVTQARVLSMQTVDGRLYLSLGYEGFAQAYEFNCGIGTEWAVRSVPRHGGAPGHKKTLRHARLLSDFDSLVPLSYRRHSSLAETQSRLVCQSGAMGGYAVADGYVQTNQLHGTNALWEFQLIGLVKKDREMVWAKASGLNLEGAPTHLAEMNRAAGGAYFAWRIDSTGLLRCWRYGSEQGLFGGTVVENDYLRIELKPNEEWIATWFDLAHAVKQQVTFAAGPFASQAINEPLGLKAIITDPGGWLAVGVIGRSGHTGCLKLYNGYGDTAPDRTFTYAPGGLTEYPWEKINLACPSYQVEACGVGAEQKPAHVRLAGTRRADHG